jgi:hypothetical protein
MLDGRPNRPNLLSSPVLRQCPILFLNLFGHLALLGLSQHGFQSDFPSWKRTMVTIPLSIPINLYPPSASRARPSLAISGPRAAIDNNTTLHPDNRWSMSVDDGEVLYFHHHVASISDLYVGPLTTHPDLQRTNKMSGRPCLSSFWAVSHGHAWVASLLSTAIACIKLTSMIL